MSVEPVSDFVFAKIPQKCYCSVPGHNKDYNNVRVRERYYFSRNRSIRTTTKYLYKTTLEHALRFFGSPGEESQSFSVPTEGRVSPIKLLHSSPSGKCRLDIEFGRLVH